MANTMKVLSTVTVGAGGAATISFTDIPQTYTDLVIKLSSRAASATNNYKLTVNDGDGTSISLYGGSGIQSSFTATSLTGLTITSGFTANYYSNGEWYIPNYASNTNSKSLQADEVQENNSASSGSTYMYLTSGVVANIAPITKLTLTPNGGISFAQHTTATLYGIFNADVSTAPATPTIGMATAAGLGANVTFTGVSNAASYKVTSSPGSITATGNTSPIYISGLSENTSYTFTVKSQNPFGESSASAQTNSITTTVAGWENLGSYTGTSPTVTFSSIPSTYQHLAILYNIRTDQAGGGANESMWIRVNGVAGTNYGENSITSTPANGVNSSHGRNQDSWGAFSTAGAGTASGTAGVGIIYLYNYSDTNIKKSYHSQNGYYDNAGQWYHGYSQGVVNLTAAINEVRIQSGNFRTWATGSRISIYGIRGA